MILYNENCPHPSYTFSNGVSWKLLIVSTVIRWWILHSDKADIRQESSVIFVNCHICHIIVSRMSSLVVTRCTETSACGWRVCPVPSSQCSSSRTAPRWQWNPRRDSRPTSSSLTAASQTSSSSHVASRWPLTACLVTVFVCLDYRGCVKVAALLTPQIRLVCSAVVATRAALPEIWVEMMIGSQAEFEKRIPFLSDNTIL